MCVNVIKLLYYFTFSPRLYYNSRQIMVIENPDFEVLVEIFVLEFSPRFFLSNLRLYLCLFVCNVQCWTEKHSIYLYQTRNKHINQAIVDAQSPAWSVCSVRPQAEHWKRANEVLAEQWRGGRRPQAELRLGIYAFCFEFDISNHYTENLQVITIPL